MDAEFFEQLQKRRNKTQSPDRDPYPAVPAELKERRQWVMWRSIKKDGKFTKIPFQPNGKRAKTSDPQTWTDYQSVCRAEGFSGVGFVFTEDDPYTGVDIDDCINEDGKLKDWAVPIVDNLKAVSYAEVSPSGKGIKAWTRAKHPVDKNREPVGDGKIEIYDKARYFTVTGHGKGEIQDGQSQVDWLCETYLKPKPKLNKPKPNTTASRVSVEECLRLLRKGANANKFERLFRGDTSEHGSPSEADAALCSVVAFYSQDPAVIDSIFRRSGLMREKWDVKHYADGSTYGEMTIRRALDYITERYTPGRDRHTSRKNNRRSWEHRSWEQRSRFGRRAF